MPESILHGDGAAVRPVIITNLDRRGNGRDDPLRRVMQVWTLEGDLLATVDPCAESQHNAAIYRANAEAAKAHSETERLVQALRRIRSECAASDVNRSALSKRIGAIVRDTLTPAQGAP